MADAPIMSSIVELAKVLAPLGAAWLGFSFTRKTSLETARSIAAIDREKYKHNSLWEARRAAYTEIVSALNALAKSTSLIDYHFNGEEAEPERYNSSALSTEHSQAMWEEFRAVKALYENHILVLSDEFKWRYADWQKDFFYEEEWMPVQYNADIRDSTMKKYIPLFIALAQAEIWPA